MNAPLKPGDVCVFRKLGPKETKDRWWTTTFPVTIESPFHIEGYWWVIDANWKRLWMNGADLVRSLDARSESLEVPAP